VSEATFFTAYSRISLAKIYKDREQYHYVQDNTDDGNLEASEG
jgi:hypothetical protein